MTPDFLSLFTAVTQHLRGGLLREMASALAISPAEAEKQCAAKLAALIQQLAQPIEAKELDARWDICRQLFASQVLVEVAALVRADLGWPERRTHLAQELLGAARYASLTGGAARPGPAAALLGYLTVVVLATVGEQAATAALAPAALGAWLGTQQVPAVVAPPPAPAPGSPEAATVPARKSKLMLFVGAAGVAALVGAYLLAGVPASASQARAEAPLAAAAGAAPPAPAAEAPPPAPAVAEAVAKAAPVAGSKLPPAVAAAPVAAPAAAPAPATPKAASGVSLRDTVGNAAIALHIGGKFDVARGRYPKGEGQPLTIKLLHNADLTVSINSTESLLYKRLANASLAQPGDIGIDRLTFEVGRASLGAEGAQQLGSIAQLLKTFPGAHLLVMGHAYNKEPQAILLGLQRANAAIDELVKQGIGADRLQAQGRMATSAPTGSEPPDKLAALQGVSLIIRK